MQPGSMLGSRSPAPGVVNSSSTAARSSSPLVAMPSLMSPPPALQFEQADHQPPPPAMDEFLDQMFALPSWTDMPGRAPWDFTAAAGAATRLGVDAQKLFTTMSLLPPGLLGASNRDLQDGPDSANVGDSMMYSNDDTLLGARLRGLQENSTVSPGIGSRGGATLTRSPSVGSSGSEGSGGPQSPPPIAPTWRQPYVGGVPPLPMGLGQAKPESLLRGDSGEAHVLGKRSRDEDDVSNVRDGSQGLFSSFGGSQLAQTQMPRTAQQPHQQGNGAASQGLPSGVVSLYGSPTAGQPQSGSAVAAITARPRVRARRGQATDPHSIAERLRRERIAERMKALQELVPNSNKTDKASMLDEIIDYVKFLQLQVKVLSMSRLGGAGAVAPLVADLPLEGPSNYATAALGRSNGTSGPSQDGLALTERQVARLMEEDMGSAMQYLQSKGLCLMPISLASAISSSNTRSAQGAGGDRQRSETAAVLSASNAQPGMSASPTSGVDVDTGNKSGSNGSGKVLKDGTEVEKTNGGSSSSKPSPKAKAQESQRRSQ